MLSKETISEIFDNESNIIIDQHGKRIKIMDKNSFILFMEKITHQSKQYGINAYISVPDIRNKLSPITNFITMFEELKDTSLNQEQRRYIENSLKESIVQIKKIIKYLAQRDDMYPELDI